jgi:DNA-binding transcriptional ArsR family regulator
VADEGFAREAVKVFRALADPTRYRIVVMLAQRGELGCGDLAREFRLTLPAMSHHYRILENAGLVTMRKEGTHIFVRLNGERLRRFVPGFEEAHVLQSPHADTDIRRR